MLTLTVCLLDPSSLPQPTHGLITPQIAPLAQVRGYLPVDTSSMAPTADFTSQQQIIAELTQRKQELMFELTSYQNSKNLDVAQVGGRRGGEEGGRGGGRSRERHGCDTGGVV